jgi:hypothetical protein
LKREFPFNLSNSQIWLFFFFLDRIIFRFFPLFFSPFLFFSFLPGLLLRNFYGAAAHKNHGGASLFLHIFSLFIALAYPDDLIRTSFLEQQRLMEYGGSTALFPDQAAATRAPTTLKSRVISSYAGGGRGRE